MGDPNQSYYTYYWSPAQQKQNIANLYLKYGHRNLFPTKVMPTRSFARQGIHRSGRSSTRKMKGRFATKGNVLTNLVQSMAPIVRLEENFSSDQYDPNVPALVGGFAPPLAQGELGSLLYQLVVINGANQVLPNKCPQGCPTPIAANAGANSQLVQWLPSYMRIEQDLLLAAASQSSLLTANNNYLDLPNDPSTAGLILATNNPTKDFVFRGAVTTHTFVNPALTQCYFSLYEVQPRRWGNITPQECWDYDLDVNHSGMQVPQLDTTYVNLAPGVAAGNRLSSKLGFVPGNLKGGMFNYYFRILSKKSFHMEPGEEMKYKQIYPPWVDRHKMRNVLLSGTVGATYNTHTRYLLFIGHGETNVYKGSAVATDPDLNKYANFPGSWELVHTARRLSSYQCLLPTRVSQRQIVDTGDIFINTITDPTAVEILNNEEVDTMDITGTNPLP